ncbi:MAG TPA: queuosine salvage family protein [Solirubrobacteraceae bacterium]|nr:queuosine salvage family protein [Solirubrobacteraceae bacterium]
MSADVLTGLRAACAQVANQAQFVRVEPERTAAYVGTLPVDPPSLDPDPGAHLTKGTREELAAFWLTLDAINFGSGWFPTLRKRGGRSGYFTIATGVKDRFANDGPWTAAELAQLTASEIANTLGQNPDHELMALFARSLNDLGRRIDAEHGGKFAGVPDAAESSAVALVDRLAGWASFADTSRYDGLEVPFLKRAQITAADLARAGVAAFRDLDRLTIFADNLVPHVLRMDGLLSYDPSLLDRIERGELIEHDSREEIEIRACALHAVELIAAERPGATEAVIDYVLWHRGQESRYKASPRHRSRCTAY